MNRIRLLPDHVANQIAAGEVVERPASVVKELVENSLDAAARRIVVEIQAGGRSLIRVTDDGFGMSRDDALLSLERHATSKIKTAHDLASISTMGFRGEALPSIASVSRMSLISQTRDEDGIQIVIHGGKILEVKAAGAAPGTSIEVRQLFYNLPARRKFLRSEETERAHIQHYLTLAALAHPECALTFLQDNRVIWQLPEIAVGSEMESKHAALRERWRALRGGETRLLSVSFSAPGTFASAAYRPKASSDRDASDEEIENPAEQMLRIWGVIGAPGISRATREEQHLFVNYRPVENRGLNFALLEGYHTSLMKGRYPVCCLFLEIDPAGVDVNIHPSKKEVKFHREHDVRNAMMQAVRQSLLKYHENSPEKDAAATRASPVSSSAFPELKRANAVQLNPLSLFRTPESGKDAWRTSPAREAGFVQTDPASNLPAPGVPPANLPSGIHPSPVRAESMQPVSAPISVDSADAITGSGIEAMPLLQVPLRVVGVINRLYVVLESDRGLVLLDQHAAHERILFEQMLRRLEQGETPSQRLLLPETVELSPKDAQFLKEQLPALARLGVGLSEFGERTFLLDALPPFVNASAGRRFVLEVIDELKVTGPETNSWRLGEQTVAKTVCRHAVKANDPLSVPELENLVNDLRRCAMPYTCPHGRPTLIEFSHQDLEKRFGRSQ